VTSLAPARAEREGLPEARRIAEQAFSRAAGAPLVTGNRVRLLQDAGENYPAWLEAIAAAERSVHFESYIYEWDGPMLHAKTAVADGRWARVGSTNLNAASWLGNYELDVVVEDEPFAEEMERAYLRDLTHATEIVLERHRVRTAPGVARALPARGRTGGSAGRAAAGALRLANTVGAAMTNSRVLGHAEADLMLGVGLLLLVFSVLSFVWPRLVAFPLAALGAWLAVSLLIRARRLHAQPKTGGNTGTVARTPVGKDA
jgi:cardiolipin synthase